MKRLGSLLGLFLSMMKIGLFTFGGGYAMIHILDSEFVGKRRWLDPDEFGDLVAIAESTPGPIAINCSTYIGYRIEGLLGAIFATLGMCIPSFTVIYFISLFFDRFLEIDVIASAFRGIQIAVVFLIFSAGLKMLKRIKKTKFNLAVMAITFICMVTFSLLAVSFSTIFYILIFGGVSLFVYAVGYLRDRGEGKE